MYFNKRKPYPDKHFSPIPSQKAKYHCKIIRCPIRLYLCALIRALQISAGNREDCFKKAGSDPGCSHPIFCGFVRKCCVRSKESEFVGVRSREIPVDQYLFIFLIFPLLEVLRQEEVYLGIGNYQGKFVLAPPRILENRNQPLKLCLLVKKFGRLSFLIFFPPKLCLVVSIFFKKKLGYTFPFLNNIFIHNLFIKRYVTSIINL